MAKSNHRSVDKVERGQKLERIARLRELDRREQRDFRRIAQMGWQEDHSEDDDKWDGDEVAHA